jgi:hypothetical protein
MQMKEGTCRVRTIRNDPLDRDAIQPAGFDYNTRGLYEGGRELFCLPASREKRRVRTADEIFQQRANLIYRPHQLLRRPRFSRQPAICAATSGNAAR